MADVIKSKTIILFDDRADDRRLNMLELKSLGHQVSDFGTLEGTMQALCQEDEDGHPPVRRFQIAVVDFNVANSLNAKDSATIIAECIRRGTKVMVVSEQQKEELTERAMAAIKRELKRAPDEDECMICPTNGLNPSKFEVVGANIGPFIERFFPERALTTIEAE